MALPQSAPARALILILAAQAGAFYLVASRSELLPDVRPLSAFPQSSAGWRTAGVFPLEKEVQDVLRADDTLNRVYVAPEQNATASLFIAFFKTQRYGQSPHSPKNCMPGAGWAPLNDRKLPIAVPGREAPIVVNEYVIQRGNDQSVVLYWYQSHNRIVASELTAKFWLVADAIRQRRSDTALVRIVVPAGEQGVAAAETTAVRFAQSVYPDLARQLPR